MKKIIIALSFFILSMPNLSANDSFNFGIEAGWAHAVGLEDEAKEVGQALANALGETVTVETDTGAIYVRPYIESQIEDNITVEGGLLISSDIDTTFSITGASISISQDVFGFDVIGNYDFNNGFKLRAGIHRYDIDGEATVTLSSESASVTSTDSGIGFMIGATYATSNEGKMAIARYQDVGGEADINTFSFLWSF